MISKDFGTFVGWVFQATIAGGVALGVSNLSQLRQSVEELNVKMATMLEKTATHEKQIDKHEDRLRDLETRTVR